MPTQKIYVRILMYNRDMGQQNLYNEKKNKVESWKS